MMFPVKGGAFNSVNKKIRKHELVPTVSTERICILSCARAGTDEGDDNSFCINNIIITLSNIKMEGMVVLLQLNHQVWHIMWQSKLWIWVKISSYHNLVRFNMKIYQTLLPIISNQFSTNCPVIEE